VHAEAIAFGVLITALSVAVVFDVGGFAQRVANTRVGGGPRTRVGARIFYGFTLVIGVVMLLYGFLG
jgi:hypothetical protein